MTQQPDTKNNNALIIKDLRVSVEGKTILNGINLTIKKGEIHALMGPNGSGKSTLSYTLMGHPGYKVEGGEVLFNGEDLLGMAPDERARKGMFLGFQYPVSIPGVSMGNFIRMAVNAVKAKGDNEKRPIPIPKFHKLLKEKMSMLRMDSSFASRYLNDGFSGGEKKKAEILQMAMLEPEIAILDETDSGLDIDALKFVADGVNSLVGPNLGVLIITHYKRILNYIKPQFVHVLYKGKIIVSGGSELAQLLEDQGYEEIKKKYAS
ncbi:MAG: Fe-S cluster assembly ATPase SufC [Candidatus Anammoxibacter sp.]